MRVKALEGLSGKWNVAVVATLVYFLISSLQCIADATGILALPFYLCVIAPLDLGYNKFALKIARHEEVEVGNIFEGFQYFGKVVLLTLLIFIFVILWSFLLIVPGIIAAFRYSQAYFILLDNPDISPMEAIERSKQMMVGNKGKLFLLGLSFIGWAILNIFTVGIGSLWLLPYGTVSLAVFYLELQGEQTKTNLYID